MQTEIPSSHPDNQTNIFEGIGDAERHEYEHGIKRARNALFIAGGIMFVVDVAMVLMNRDALTETYMWTLIGLDVVILLVFIGLGLWTKKKPFTALLTGLILFCVIQIFAMIGDPSNIYKGIIVKIAVVATLVAGIKKAKRLQELNRIAGY